MFESDRIYTEQNSMAVASMYDKRNANRILGQQGQQLDPEYQTAPSSAIDESDRKAEYVDCLAPVLKCAYRVAFNLTSNQDDAQDLVQDAAVQAYRKFNSYHQGTNFKAWYLKILTNCFLMSIRKQQSRPVCVSSDISTDHYSHTQIEEADTAQETQDPADVMARKLDSDQIALAFQKLPGKYRMVCVYHFIHDITYQEIAVQLNIPVGTVRSRLHRGRKLLQKYLEPISECA